MSVAAPGNAATIAVKDARNKVPEDEEVFAQRTPQKR
jgi:hypothetical protein